MVTLVFGQLENSRPCLITFFPYVQQVYLTDQARSEASGPIVEFSPFEDAKKKLRLVLSNADSSVPLMVTMAFSNSRELDHRPFSLLRPIFLHNFNAGFYFSFKTRLSVLFLLNGLCYISPSRMNCFIPDS